MKIVPSTSGLVAESWGDSTKKPLSKSISSLQISPHGSKEKEAPNISEKEISHSLDMLQSSKNTPVGEGISREELLSEESINVNPEDKSPFFDPKTFKPKRIISVETKQAPNSSVGNLLSTADLSNYQCAEQASPIEDDVRILPHRIPPKDETNKSLKSINEKVSGKFFLGMIYVNKSLYDSISKQAKSLLSILNIATISKLDRQKGYLWNTLTPPLKEKQANGKEMIIEATVPSLVNSLITGSVRDHDSLVVFLRTYRYFAHPTDIARLLMMSYLDSPTVSEHCDEHSIKMSPEERSDNLRLTIINVFRKWINDYKYDFKKHSPLAEFVKLFLEDYVKLDLKKAPFANSMLETLESMPSAANLTVNVPAGQEEADGVSQMDSRKFSSISIASSSMLYTEDNSATSNRSSFLHGSASITPNAFLSEVHNFRRESDDSIITTPSGEMTSFTELPTTVSLIPNTHNRAFTDSFIIVEAARKNQEMREFEYKSQITIPGISEDDTPTSNTTPTGSKTIFGVRKRTQSSGVDFKLTSLFHSKTLLTPQITLPPVSYNGLKNATFKYAHTHISDSTNSLNTNSTSILDFDAEILGQQLTIIEDQKFRDIPLNEFFLQAWSDKKNKEALAPNLIRYISWFNYVASGVASEVLRQKDLNDRVKVIKRLIYAAHCCFGWANYNTCFEIVAGLNLSPISRLKNTWKELPKKYWDLWNLMNKIVSNESSYKVYRASISPLKEKMGDIPILPYIGVNLTDLTFTEDGNPTFIPSSTETNKIVNYAKFNLISQSLSTILLLQKSPKFDTMFKVDERTKDWIENCWPVFSEKNLYEISKMVEPKQRNY